MRRWSALALVLLACGEGDPDASPKPTSKVESAPGVVSFGPGDAGELIGVPAPVLAESDAPASYWLYRESAGIAETRALGLSVRHAHQDAYGLTWVSEDGQLQRQRGGGAWRNAETLATHVLGNPAHFADGRVVVSRTGPEPGESDLYLWDRGHLRALTTAPGPDEMPYVVGRGQLVFVSGRTGIASLWHLDLDSGQQRQLTNRGLRRVDRRFIPPPVRDLRVRDGELDYDAGDGARYRVDLRSGAP